MIRSFIPGAALALPLIPLGNAIAAHDWLVALPLAVVVIAGVVLISPRASALPSPPAQPEAPALATGDEG